MGVSVAPTIGDLPSGASDIDVPGNIFSYGPRRGFLFMKHQHAIKRTSVFNRRRALVLRAVSRAIRDWAVTDGLIWLHVLKTVLAALLALGIAMLLDLPQPRTAMTTVFVLMQPLSGMVLAKSFYRILGTAVGMMAAVVLGAIFIQQPELYILGLTCWVGACTAAAVRYRHFRWYGFVLAGYTAALIGVPVVMAPNGLFLAALTRAAEVMLGIVCSSAVSALVLPLRSTTALQSALQSRYLNITAFAATVVGSRVERSTFERRFADLVDEIVGFEAARTFAAFEDPGMRSRSQRLARLNSEYMDACTRLHALNQLLKRLRANGATPVTEAIEPYFVEFASLLRGQVSQLERGAHHPARVANALRAFQASLPRRVRETRRLLESSMPDALPDYDTSGELLYRFVAEFIRYTQTYASLADHNPARERSATRYVNKTNGFVVALTFLRTAVVMTAVGWFWIATNWPSGGLAVISAALTCALTSTAPNASRLAVQMAVGAALATVTGYLYTCYVYPNIDGFPLLCAALTPALALGAFFASRPRTSGYGVGFAVFFCLLAAPDNVVTFAPDLLVNNGLAVVSAMLVAAVGFEIVFPQHMSWLIDRIRGDLRRQVVLACKGSLEGLNQHFQSSTHDLMYQLRVQLKKQSRRHRDALRWMLLTLEVGHAMIDLRNEAAGAAYAATLHPRWEPALKDVSDDITRLFERPDAGQLKRALVSVRAATWVAQQILEAVHSDRERRHALQRILGSLHFIRSALLDKDAPFNLR